jgi:colanic acid/amylovoran biosynthesis glycosyltransferase
VVSNIVETIKYGFQVAILTDKKNSLNDSSQPELLSKYSVLKKIFTYSEPFSKGQRYLKAFRLLLNPVLFFYFIKYTRFKGKINWSLLFRLHHYLPYRKANVIHVHFANAIAPLFELKQIGFLKSKIIVTFHGFDAHFLPEGENLQRLRSDFNAFVDNITVNSTYLKQKLIEKGFEPNTIKIVAMGVDVEFFKPQKPIELDVTIFKMLTVGRLIDLKGIHLGLEVVNQLAKGGYAVNYSIVGEGKELSNLTALAKTLGIEKQVNFLGKKNQNEIKELLEDQHLFLMTSTVDQDNRREAFGVVSLEAQAMELPVVGFNSGGFPETIVDGKTGFLVQDQDVEGLAAAVEKLINDRALLQQMGINARQHVLENFSFEKTTKKYLDLYR